MFSPFFSLTWKYSFICSIISLSVEVLLPLKSVKFDVFFSWLLQFSRISFFGYFICDSLSVKSGESLNFPRVLFREETMWVCSILKLFKSSFSFMSYSGLEETNASYTKLLGSFAIYFLHLSQIPYPFWIFGTFIIQPNTDLRVFLELAPWPTF